MMRKQVIYAQQIAIMAGTKMSASQFVANKTQDDPTFPAPIIKGGQKGKSQWFLHEIEAWIQAKAQKKPQSGRNEIAKREIDTASAFIFLTSSQRKVPTGQWRRS